MGVSPLSEEWSLFLVEECCSVGRAAYRGPYLSRRKEARSSQHGLSLKRAGEEDRREADRTCERRCGAVVVTHTL